MESLTREHYQEKQMVQDTADTRLSEIVHFGTKQCWTTEHLTIRGKSCHENDSNHPMNHAKDEPKNGVLRTSRSSPIGMMGQRSPLEVASLSASTKKKCQSLQNEIKSSKRRSKSDSLVKRCSDILNVKRFPLGKEATFSKEHTSTLENIQTKDEKQSSAKQFGSITSIADMSKVITKYDEAERRYIGTTIELVKKDSRMANSGISVWNQMPKHRLGYPDKKRKINGLSFRGIDTEALCLKLTEAFAVKNLDLQDRCCDSASRENQGQFSTSDEDKLSQTTNKALKELNTKSDRVNKFLADALEANADILGLGVPFRPKSSSKLIKADKKIQHKSLGDNNANDVSLFSNKMHRESQKINITCIHLENEERKAQPNQINNTKKEEICNVCSKARIYHRQQKTLPIPEAPPTTPTSTKALLKKNKQLKESLKGNGVKDSRRRTQTQRENTRE
ncbi:uncharacterized protein LOC135690630 [Rhopilema esculentum]|uniref:uncharacterized protein LOC135690630 n=1 Tax=Rhopilema esculentum TaxID=499914 RepID=UPI0031DAB064